MMLDNVCDNELRKAVFKCGIFILRVHPCHWTHFANLPDFDDNNFHSSRATFILMMENYQLLIDEMNEHINQIKEKIGSKFYRSSANHLSHLLSISQKNVGM